MNYFAGKVVLLTGATGGLGAEFVRQLLTRKAHLILTDLKTDALEAFKESAASGKGRILGTLVADISTKEGTETMLAEVKKICSCPDIIINNAGIGHGGEFGSMPVDRWEKLMNINLIAPMRICHYFLTEMKARGSGHIVNISSVAGLVAVAGAAPYSTSKFGIKGFSDAIRQEYAKAGLWVSSVHPFFARTAILQSERFGSVTGDAKFPDFLIESPADVIRETLDALARKEEFILPSTTSKVIDLVQRFAPNILRTVSSLVE